MFQVPLPPKEPQAESHETPSPPGELGPGLASRGLKERVLLLPHEDGYRQKPDSQVGGGAHGSLGKSTANSAVLRAFWELWNSTGNWMTEGAAVGTPGAILRTPVVQGGQKGPDLPFGRSKAEPRAF